MRGSRGFLCVWSLCVWLAPTFGFAQGTPEADPSREAASAGVYTSHIQPLLKTRCYSCHGALKQEAGLRLDTVAAMLVGGDSGAAIVKSEPDASLLLERVADPEPASRMPPEHEGEPLDDKQLARIREWIASGAAAPPNEQPEADPRKHWAFQPLVRPTVPTVQRADWVANPIDAFIAKRHEELGLTPQPPATMLEQLRRLSMDLTGLPPSLEDVMSLQQHAQPDWYERQVSDYLKSTAHAERWARHWMDIWRYSDWWGLNDQLRNSQKHIWHWRDWIIESLDRDLPYDEIIRRMLAADEIHPGDIDQLRATGFLARNYFIFNRHPWMDETVEHVSKAFLGLTTNCAKCHDHKYDPISQVDYYRLRAFFEPYHVRLDMLPGETDLNRNGLPRVFDGQPHEPTYLLIRGQENQPDRSRPLSPGVPDILNFATIKPEPIALPMESWQPERRAWVAENHRRDAEALVKQAEEKLAAVREKLWDAPMSLTAGELHEVDHNVLIAELTLAIAESKQQSLEQRIAAMHAQWARQDSREGTHPTALAAQEKKAAQAAARSEREVALAQARLEQAAADWALSRAANDKREAAEKRLTQANDALRKAQQQLEEASDRFTPLSGARWSATRFQHSGRDDPAIPFPAQSTGRRTALANWITDARNPLTARVAVNHIWTRHFGRPLVDPVFDFGRNGSLPTHPELLDWLAVEFIESGWSMKHIHKLIVQSSTYRLSSTSENAENNLARDPENVHYWRWQSNRLESQAIRDTLLALSGTLDGTQGGPPVPPEAQADSTRRSVYFFHSNNDRNHFLTMFDEALVKECYRREQSIVPQQALAMTNSSLVLASAERIARRLSEALGGTQDATEHDPFVSLAFAMVLGKAPDATEMKVVRQAMQAWQALPEADRSGSATAFARTQLIWVLLNHNDFVTLR
jgi:hypothetical protein